MILAIAIVTVTSGLSFGQFVRKTSSPYFVYLQTGTDKVIVGPNTITPYNKLDVDGTLGLRENDLLFRGKTGQDLNHGIGWYGTGKLWNGITLDGPVLYGYLGGMLGTNRGGTRTNMLYWNTTSVGIGTTSPDPSCVLHINNSTYPSVQIGSRWLSGTAQPLYLLGLNNNQTYGNTDCILNLNSQAGQSGIEFFRAGQQKWYLFNRPDDGAGHPDRLEFYNNTTRMTLDQDGTLRVPNKIRTGEIYVTTNVWADYVFDKNYKLASLGEVEDSIKVNGHLPGIPGQKEIKEVSVGDMQVKLLEKIEELTLHMIALEKTSEQLKKENASLKTQISQMR